MRNIEARIILLALWLIAGIASAYGDTPVLFDVRFDANGGMFRTQVESTYYSCEQTLGNEYSFPPFEPENPPWRFGGYWTDRYDGERVDAYTIVSNSALHTLYAHWLDGKEVTVHFDANGGTVYPAWHVYRTGTTYFTLPIPTREHYDFAGWYVDPDSYWSEKVDVATKVIESDHELYAHWRPSRYTIRFHANNGTTRTRDQTFTYDEDVRLNQNWFSNGSYVFAGWSKVPGGIAEYGDREHIGRITALQDGIIHLYAVWSGPAYSVRFDSHGGEGRMENQTFIIGQAQALAPCGFSREGFEFAGWSRSTVGAPVFRDGAVVKDLVSTQDATVVLYAVWKDPDNSPAGYCAISVNASCESPDAQGVVSMSSSSGLVRIGSSVTLSARAANAGTVFVHWVDGYGEVVGTSTTLKVTPAKSEDYWAIFRSKATVVSPEFSDGNVFVGGGNEAKGFRHVKFSAKVAVDDSCLPVKFAARNLPAGLKINPATGEISGVPTAAKTYRPTITVTSVVNPRLSASSTVKMVISSLPSWVTKKMDGYVLADDGRLVLGTGNIAATSSGKISGKFNIGGTNWVLSASSFSSESTPGAAILDARMVASGTATATVGKKTFKMPWKWTASPVYLRNANYSGYTLRGSSGVCSFGSGGGMTAQLRHTNLLFQFRERWQGIYEWIEPDGGHFEVMVPNGPVKGKTARGVSVSCSGKFLWDCLQDDDPDAQCQFAFYCPPKTVNKKKCPAFGALVDLVNFPGVPVPGDYVAYRRQGVRAESDWTSTGSGSISYSPYGGQAIAGKTVTVRATPRSNSVFAYWLQDGKIVSYSQSYKVVMGEGDHNGLTAVFRLKSDFYSRPDVPYVVESDGGNPFYAIRVGVAFKARVDVDEMCRPVKFTAKNLPKGLAINSTTGVISGVPTVAGKKTIVITATSVAKPKLVSSALKVPVNVAKLPSWAIGTFKAKGVLGGKSGNVTLTIDKTGKISGKFTVGRKSYAFSAASYSEENLCLNGDNSFKVYSGVSKVKYGTKSYPVKFSVQQPNGKTKVLVVALDGEDEYGYFSTDGGSVAVRGGDCESNAVLFKVGETKTFKLISEYNEEYGVYYDNWGVAYFKFTALKGKGYEMIVCSDSPDAMLAGYIFPSKDSDCWWGSGCEVDELDDGSILLRIPADEWEEEDPRAVLAIGLVSGDVGTRVKVELRQIP